jgi:hypothetical protein
MKKQKLLVILISIVVIQSIILSVLFIQALSSNNSNDLSNETQETEQVTFETLSNNITLLINGSVRDIMWTNFYVDIENKNSESIKYISGTILYYDEQNQLLHTLGFEHDTLIPGNFTRTKALYLSIPSNVQRVYTRYEVIFDDIELS